jgi:hypothetical protein
MPVTRDQAYKALSSLNPARVFLDSYRVSPLPENLDIYFRPPDEFFDAPDQQELCTRGRLIPILDDGSFELITFLDPESKALVQIDIDTPGEVRATFSHWQQYLADLMMRIGESVDDDDRVRRKAELVGFAHTAKLFGYFDRARDFEGQAAEEARRLFPLSIPN